MGWNELNANATVSWMSKNAQSAGWVQLTDLICKSFYDAAVSGRKVSLNSVPAGVAAVAGRITTSHHADLNLLKQPSYVSQQFANAGLPAVMVWANPKRAPRATWPWFGRKRRASAAERTPKAASCPGRLKRAVGILRTIWPVGSSPRPQPGSTCTPETANRQRNFPKNYSMNSSLNFAPARFNFDPEDQPAESALEAEGDFDLAQFLETPDTASDWADEAAGLEDESSYLGSLVLS